MRRTKGGRGGSVKPSREPGNRVVTGMAFRLGCLLTVIGLAATGCASATPTSVATQVDERSGYASAP
jgi:hypothetical protein